MKKQATTTTTTTKDFAQVRQEFERLYTTDRRSTAYATALQEFGQAIAFSVLKKIHEKSGNATIAKLRQQTARDIKGLETLRYAVDNATETRYTDSGDLEIVVLDKDLDLAVKKGCGQSLGDGLDLVNDAIVAILATAADIEKAGKLGENFMETTVEMRVLNRRVLIKADPTVPPVWETVETTPIQQAYKAVRRRVNDTQSVKSASGKYIYIDEQTTDDQSGTEDRIYRRLPAYSGLAGEVLDGNGKPFTAAADNETVFEAAAILERLNLTKREMDIITLRLRGKTLIGNKSIAKALGITENACKGAIHRLRDKAIKAGLDPHALPIDKW